MVYPRAIVPGLKGRQASSERVEVAIVHANVDVCLDGRPRTLAIGS
jgi:hypothetical protein